MSDGSTVAEHVLPVPVVRRRSRRRRWMIGVVVVSVVVGTLIGLGFVATFRLLFSVKNAYALAYADQMEAHGGYVRIDDYNGGAGSCDCDLDRWYMGPANADPTVVFTGPGLSLAPTTTVNDQT